MKEVSSFEIIENPQFVKEIDMPEVGGKVSLFEDGSVFNHGSGRYFAPEKEDTALWQMRQIFDRTKAIRPGDRYSQAQSLRRFVSQRYGLVS